MSEIRPASQRPEPPRVQQERPAKTEQKVKSDPPPKMEPQREVARQEVKSNDKPKGGNVDIMV
jgi:outer membrane biosynthesis protein TonB